MIGGDLSSLLRALGYFDESMAAFYLCEVRSAHGAVCFSSCVLGLLAYPCFGEGYQVILLTFIGRWRALSCTCTNMVLCTVTSSLTMC
jgi:hypothetical protein